MYHPSPAQFVMDAYATGALAKDAPSIDAFTYALSKGCTVRYAERVSAAHAAKRREHLTGDPF